MRKRLSRRGGELRLTSPGQGCSPRARRDLLRPRLQWPSRWLSSPASAQCRTLFPYPLPGSQQTLTQGPPGEEGLCVPETGCQCRWRTMEDNRHRRGPASGSTRPGLTGSLQRQAPRVQDAHWQQGPNSARGLGRGLSQHHTRSLLLQAPQPNTASSYGANSWGPAPPALPPLPGTQPKDTVFTECATGTILTALGQAHTQRQALHTGHRPTS